MSDIQEHKPRYLSLDKSPKHLTSLESPYLLNNNSGNVFGDGDESTPYPASVQLCDMELPSGFNHNGGRYYDPVTKEMYYWTYNSNGINFISRVKSSGECEVVYDGECISVNPDPKHEVTKFRAYLKVEENCNKVPGGVLKQLVWVDGTDTPIGMIDVEASVVTDGFSTPFFDLCRDDCAYTQMHVPKPSAILNPVVSPFTEEDRGRPSYIMDYLFKFMYRHVYYDGRRSEWSDKSAKFILRKDGCFEGNIGRCLEFWIPLGNPMVEKIEFACSYNGGMDWSIVDTIHKYKSLNDGHYWFERQLKEGLEIDGCEFKYRFCNDKLGTPISKKDAFRVSDPAPVAPQGFFPIAKGLAFFNYKKGTCPINRSEIDKIKITPDCEKTDSECVRKMTKVTVRAVIYNESSTSNSVVKKTEDGEYFFAKRGGGTAGYYDQAASVNQIFNNSKNFRVYIKGQESFNGEMQQYYASDSNLANAVKMDTVESKTFFSDLVGGLYFQQYEFYVPQGTEGFVALSSHEADSLNVDTSTLVKGIFTVSLNGMDGNFLDQSKVDIQRKELYFDTCGKDVVDVVESFWIKDYTRVVESPAGMAPAYTIYPSVRGYLTDIEGSPVEGAQVFYKTPGRGDVTDQNGFFHLHPFDTSYQEASDTVHIAVEKKCNSNFEDITTFKVNGVKSKDALAISEDHSVVITDEDYSTKNYARVVVTVNGCDNNPVDGAVVAISGSKHRVTNNLGIATFKVRNYSTRDRKITVVFMNKNGCLDYDCDGKCNPCMPSVFRQLPACLVVPGPSGYAVMVDLGILNVNTKTVSLRQGLKHGGVYPFGAVVEYLDGRTSAVYNIGTVTMPGLSETGYDFCLLKYDATGLVLPKDAKSLKIVMAPNRINVPIQWIVDKKEMTPNGNIKVTVQSLNDYNSSFNFKTNTKYQFVEGDVFDLIKDDTGGILPVPKSYRVLSPSTNSDGDKAPDADFFNQLLLLPDNPSDSIKKGSVFEIRRKRVVNEDTQPYMGIGVSIPVVDGKLESETGTFISVDTFVVRRNIGTFGTQLFESQYPSDFITFIESGDVYYEDEYENEKRYQQNITINSGNVFNHFDGTEKQFRKTEQDGIVAISLRSDNVGLAICESSEFVFRVSDGTLRMDGGVVGAAPAGDFITDAQGTSGNFGCDYSDVGGINFGNGFCSWVSKDGKYVVNDYNGSKEVSMIKSEDGSVYPSCGSWFFENNVKKYQPVLDPIHRYRYSTGEDVNSGKVFITFKRWSDAGTSNGKKAGEFPNETIVYLPKEDAFSGFVSFTPEGYSYVPLEEGTAFISFDKSVPFLNPIDSVDGLWNSFFGVPCDWVVAVVVNKGLEDIKIPLAIEEQSDDMFFAYEITTDEVGALSEIPAANWKQQQPNKWNSFFMGNINSVGGLFNGKNMRGFWINIIFVRDNTQNLEYGSINNNKRVKYGKLCSILTKFRKSKQSGFSLK